MKPAEKERLVLLIEECGEVIQAAAKALRFGYGGPRKLSSLNRARLEHEIGGLLCIVRLMTRYGDVSAASIKQAAQRKRDKLKQWSNQ